MTITTTNGSTTPPLLLPRPPPLPLLPVLLLHRLAALVPITTAIATVKEGFDKDTTTYHSITMDLGFGFVDRRAWVVLDHGPTLLMAESSSWVIDSFAHCVYLIGQSRVYFFSLIWRVGMLTQGHGVLFCFPMRCWQARLTSLMLFFAFITINLLSLPLF